MNLLDAQFGEPEAQTACLLARPAPRRGLRVATPEQNGIGIFGDILEQVVLMSVLAQRLLAPSVLCTPVPTFPRVRLASLHGKTTGHIQQVCHAAMGAMQRASLAMAIGLSENGVAAVGLINAHDLGSNDVGGFVPADALELALATVLGMTLALRIPVHTLQRERNAVRRIRTRLVQIREGRIQGLHQRLKRVAFSLNRPVVQIFFGVVIIEMHRAHTNDPAVHCVNGGDVCTVAERAQRHVLHDCLISGFHTPPTFSIVFTSLARGVPLYACSIKTTARRENQ